MTAVPPRTVTALNSTEKSQSTKPQSSSSSSSSSVDVKKNTKQRQQIHFDVLKKLYEARNYELVQSYYREHLSAFRELDENSKLEVISMLQASEKLGVAQSIDPVQQTFNCKNEKKQARAYFYNADNVSGGLESMSGMPQERQEVLADILSFVYPKILKRKLGVLLYGPPGTGKTVMAREIASAIWREVQGNAAFFLFSGTNLKGAYYSNTEKNVGAAFLCAQELAQELKNQNNKTAVSVVFMDEVDSLVISRKSGSTVDVSTTNAVLRAIDPKYFDQTYLIAATNFPDNLDPAFNSRVPKRIFIDLPSDKFRRQLIVDTVRAFYMTPEMKALEKTLKGKSPSLAMSRALEMESANERANHKMSDQEWEQLQAIRDNSNSVFRLVWSLTSNGNEFLSSTILDYVTLRTGLSPDGYNFMQKKMGTTIAREYLESRGRAVARDEKPVWSLFGFSARDIVALVDGAIEKSGLAFLQQQQQQQQKQQQKKEPSSAAAAPNEPIFTSRMFQQQDFDAAAANVFASLNDPEEYWRYLQYYLYKGAPPPIKQQ